MQIHVKKNASLIRVKIILGNYKSVRNGKVWKCCIIRASKLNETSQYFTLYYICSAWFHYSKLLIFSLELQNITNIFKDPSHLCHRNYFYCISLVVSCNIFNTRDSVSSGYPDTEKRVENTTRSGVYLTKFEVFEEPMKQSLAFDNASQSKLKPKEWSENWNCQKRSARVTS